MGGFEIFVMLVGALVGAGAVYWWQENRIKSLEKDHKRALRKMAESTERNYTERKYPPLQANTQVAPPSQSQRLMPTVMQGAPAPIPTSSARPVPTDPRSPEEPRVSVEANLPTEPLVDLSERSDTVVEEIEESPFALPEETDDLDLSALSDSFAEEAEDLASTYPEALLDLTELSDSVAEVAEESPFTPLGEANDLDISELSDTTIELPEVLPLNPVDQTDDLFELNDLDISELSDTTIELPEVLPLNPVDQTDDLFERSDEMPEATIAPPITPPTSQVTNKITAKIATWGQLANPKYIPQILEYANHPDAIVREQVATGLGQIAAANPINAYLPKVIPILEQLSRDRHLETRYQAIFTLGQIKSERVIPILTSALREPSTRLVKVASNALNKLKHYSSSEIKPLELPKQVIYKKPLR